MKPGDLVRLATIKDYGSDGRSWIEYRSEKGVALLLGTEPKKSVRDDDHWLATMNALGFIRTDQLLTKEWTVVKKRIEAKLRTKSKKVR